MVSDFRPTVMVGDYTPKELEAYLRDFMAANDDTETWGSLRNLTMDWYRLRTAPAVIMDAVTPYTRWVYRLMSNPIPWKARWYILFTGQLPDDL